MAKALRQFLAGLATDPNKMVEYIRDPNAAMAAAGLSRADQSILQNAGAAALNAGLARGDQLIPPPPTHTYAIAHGSTLIYVTVLSLDGGSHVMTGERMGVSAAIGPVPAPIVVHPPITVRPPPPPITVHPPITLRTPPPPVVVHPPVTVHHPKPIPAKRALRKKRKR